MYNREYKSQEFMDFLADPEKILQQSTTVTLKAGRSATVAQVTVGARIFVVKRYNIKNGWHWLRRCLRKTRAACSWRLAQRLYTSGIATPKPIAFIDTHFYGLRGKSYFVMEYVHGPHAGDYFSTSQPQCKDMIKRIVAIFKNLKELNMTHGDLKMTNILIANQRPVLIDLDGMREHRSSRRYEQHYKKDLQRFMQNWEQQPDIYGLFEEQWKGLPHDEFVTE